MCIQQSASRTCRLNADTSYAQSVTDHKKKIMNHVIRTIFLIIPFFISCQHLPIQELKKKGLTQEEINKTNSLNGKNGVNDNFLIFRQKNISQNPNFKMFTNNFELYRPEGELVSLTEYKNNQSEIVYFEFLGEEILMIERILGLRKQIRISKYNTNTTESKIVLNAEIPCKFENDCEWIKPLEKELAFFTNLESNEGLEPSSIYEYNWQTDETRLIYGKLPFAIDAVSGRNFELSDVKYNEKINKFEYGQ